MLANNPKGGLDWTLPYMIYVCKLGAFAWDYHDGQISEEKIREDRRMYRITAMPNLLEYYAWMFFFAGYLTGPFSSFNEYISFTNRSMFAETKGQIPSGYKAFFQKILFAAVAFLLVKVNGTYNEKFVLTEEFGEKSMLYKMLYIILSVETGSGKYYFGWGMGEAAATCIGISFNGLDSNGNAKWDRLQMIRFFEFNSASDAKGIIDNWNIPCQLWLKHYVFARLLPHIGFRPAKVLTFIASAFWHGFYPGYYLFFVSGAFLEPLALQMRRALRWRVLNKDGSGKPIKVLYDLGAWIGVFYTIDYLTIGFRMLYFWDGLAAWASVHYMCHVICGVLLVITSFAPSGKEKKVD